MKKLSNLHLKKVESVKLSTDQMKKILGGDEGCSASSCAGECTVTIAGSTYKGKCDWDTSTGNLLCGCKVYG